MRLAAIVTVIVLCLPFRAQAQHPNDSIVPERPKPTPYGLQISRSDDLPLKRAEFENAADMPELAPYLETFEEAENDGGPYDFKLTEPLHDLGRAQRAAGDYRRAMAQFRRALHVERINEGLHSPTQLPIMGDMIDTHLAMGNFDSADKLYEVRFILQRRTYALDSPELERATEEYIEWQRQAYLQGIGGESYLRLLEMHEVHSHDIEFLQEANPDDPALVPHLYEQLLVEYLISQYNGEKQPSLQINLSGAGALDPAIGNQLEGERFRRLKEPAYNFRNGLRTLKDIERIEALRETPDPMALAQAKLAQGDWYLWWQKSSRALEHYEEAWAVLSEDGSALTDPDALFPHPVELPDTKVFQSDGLKPTEDAMAMARVSMGVSREGRAREIEILEQEPPGDVGARVVLYRLLREVRFRPIVREGIAVPYAGIEREYRYHY